MPADRVKSRRGGPAQAGTTREVALGLLAGRPLSEAELRRRLRDGGHPEPEIDATCTALHAAGLLDDRRLAEHFILTRADRLGHGPQRLVDDLERQGVPRELARRVLDQLVERGDLDPAALLRRAIDRGARGAGGKGNWTRMYNALLRAGFDAGAIRSELEPRGWTPDFDSDLDHEADATRTNEDDFA